MLEFHMETIACLPAARSAGDPLLGEAEATSLVSFLRFWAMPLATCPIRGIGSVSPI